VDFFSGGLSEFGYEVVKLILAMASQLVEKHAPGLVASAFILALITSLIWFFLDTGGMLKSIRFLKKHIGNSKNEEEFWSAYIDTQSKIDEKMGSSGSLGRLVGAWSEFCETLILPIESKGGEVVKNTCRPNVFFNREDLHLEHGFWRQVPSIFVSLGLLATFLGLISALNEASGALTSSGSQEALSRLLSVATAKFIMSLTGLACSIVFNIYLRFRNSQIDLELLRLCEIIEERLHFQSNEMLAMEQLLAIKMQGETLQTFSNDLVANLGRSLREELPEKIKTSISEALAPIAESIKKSSTDGVSDMVNSISDRLSGGFESSLQTVSETLLTVGTSLNSIANRMDTSSGKMGEEMDSAVQQLSNSIEQLNTMMKETSETATDTINDGANTLLESMNNALEGIKQNTEEGSAQLTQAARKISEAADQFNETMAEVAASTSEEMRKKIENVTGEVSDDINQAGVKVASSMSDAVSLMTKEADQFAEAMGENLIQPIDDLRESVEALNVGMSTNSEKISKHSTVIERSSDATNSANDALNSSIVAFELVANPIKESVEQTQNAAKQMSQSISEASRALLSGVEKSNEATINAIEHANDAFNMSRETVDHSLAALNSAVVKFGDVVERYDEIDEGLGEAFEKIETSVKGSIDEIGKFTTELHSQYEEALSTLRAVVEMNNPFDPQSNK
jgi:methyl-accepting chemotaxis protein